MVQPEIISLDAGDNVRAWLQCRHVLLNAGPRFLYSSLAFVSGFAVLSLVIGAAVFFQLCSPSAGSSKAVLGELIAAVWILVLYACIFGGTVMMIASGAALNGLTVAHTARFLQLQLKLTSTERQETPRVSADKLSLLLQSLASASQALLYAEPVKLFGLHASWGLAQSVGYASVTLLAVVGRLLNDKYGWVSWGAAG